MDLFVIDLDDPHDRWEELYRTVERALAAPAAKTEPRPSWPGIDLDPMEILHLAYWNGA